jgi:hypothetical protein
VGLAVVLALSVGLASTALAGTLFLCLTPWSSIFLHARVHITNEPGGKIHVTALRLLYLFPLAAG